MEPELVIPEVVRLPRPHDDGPEPAPLRLNRWRSTSVTGAILAAGLIGLQEALEDRRPPEIVIEYDSTGDGDAEAIALDLDPHDPAASVAVIRGR